MVGLAELDVQAEVPAELHAVRFFFGLSSPRRNNERFWWAFGDLNPGPSGYVPDALTN